MNKGEEGDTDQVLDSADEEFSGWAKIIQNVPGIQAHELTSARTPGTERF